LIYGHKLETGEGIKAKIAEGVVMRNDLFKTSEVLIARQGLGIFLFAAASIPALGSTLPPIQCVPGTLFLGVKRPGREADSSPPSSVDVKNAWSYTYTHTCVFIAWCLVKCRTRLYGVVLS
jgi:hypothetical protein